MNEPQIPPKIPPVIPEQLAKRNSTVLKITGVVLLALFLLIPLGLVNLKIEGSINPSKLHRGIYEAVVYSGQLKLSGDFPAPDFETLKIKNEDVLWNDATVTFAITDLRGTREALHLSWGAERFLFRPGTQLNGFASGIHARIAGLKAGDHTLPFSMDLTFNGSSSINFAPVGVQTIVQLTSPWPDPSFKGAFLPVERKITSAGFEAECRCSFRDPKSRKKTEFSIYHCAGVV